MRVARVAFQRMSAKPSRVEENAYRESVRMVVAKRRENGLAERKTSKIITKNVL